MKVALFTFVLSALVLSGCHGYMKVKICAWIRGEYVCKEAESQGYSINAGAYTNGDTGEVWASPVEGNTPMIGQANYPIPGRVNFPARYPYSYYQNYADQSAN